MDNEINNNNSAKGFRLVGNILVVFGVISLLTSQFMEVTVAPDYANLDVEAIKSMPEKVVNFSLVAQKINYLILGGLLILIGLKLSLISNKTISNLKPLPNENSQNQKEQTRLLKIIADKIQKNPNISNDEKNIEPKKITKFGLDKNVCPVCQNPLSEFDKKCTNCGIVISE